MLAIERINSIKNRLGGMYLYLKDKPERLADEQVRKRIERLAMEFNEMIDDLLYVETSNPETQETGNEGNQEKPPTETDPLVRDADEFEKKVKFAEKTFGAKAQDAKGGEQTRILPDSL